jgi:hypothetical protein
MASDVREYLRAAQAAEIRGDKASAAEILKAAADAFQQAGNDPRAQQMLRHVARLKGNPAEEPLEATQPDLASGLTPGIPSAEEIREASRRGERRSRAADPEFAERSPMLADPDAPAWCSFCCRPRGEVGPLVAGPAGAFICAACAGESTSLLGGPRRPSSSAPIASGAVSAPPLSRRQGEAISSLQAALGEGIRLALLIGPEGAGKTTCLGWLQAQGLGDYLASIDGAAIGPGALLLDGAEGLSAEASERLSGLLSSHPFPCVLAARGVAPSPAMHLRDRDRSVALYTTDELARATAEKIPRVLLRLVRSAVVLAAPDAGDLSQIAKHLLEEKGAAVSSELVRSLAVEAFKSGHGGHELKALVDRVPRGAWMPVGGAKQPPGPTKKPRRRKRSG